MPSKLAGLIAVAAILVGVAGCSGQGNDPTSTSGNDFAWQVGDSKPHLISVSDRQAPHGIAGTTLQGTSFNLSSYAGKVVVVNFWSSDCAPCHEEAQAFAGLATEDAAKGVAFLGIDERDNKASAIAFERQWNVAYPSLFDPTDAYLLDFPGAVPSATPFTIVLDSSGRIAGKVSGSLDYTHLKKLVDAVRTEST